MRLGWCAPARSWTVFVLRSHAVPRQLVASPEARWTVTPTQTSSRCVVTAARVQSADGADPSVQVNKASSAEQSVHDFIKKARGQTRTLVAPTLTALTLSLHSYRTWPPMTSSSS